MYTLCEYGSMYRIELSRRAQRDLRKIQRGNPRIFESVVQAIDGLSHDPYPEGHKSLGGREGYRVRIGSYRVLYGVEEDRLLVEVLRAGPRGDVYK